MFKVINNSTSEVISLSYCYCDRERNQLYFLDKDKPGRKPSANFLEKKPVSLTGETDGERYWLSLEEGYSFATSASKGARVSTAAPRRKGNPLLTSVVSMASLAQKDTLVSVVQLYLLHTDGVREDVIATMSRQALEDVIRNNRLEGVDSTLDILLTEASQSTLSTIITTCGYQYDIDCLEAASKADKKALVSIIAKNAEKLNQADLANVLASLAHGYEAPAEPEAAPEAASGAEPEAAPERDAKKAAPKKASKKASKKATK